MGVKLQKIPETEIGVQRLAIARAFIESGCYSHKQIARFLYFLKMFIYIEDSEINRNSDKQIGELTKKKNVMGIIEAIKQIERDEGREEGMGLKNHEFVCNLLCDTDFSMKRITSLAGVTEPFVRKVKRELKTAKRP